MHCCHIMFIASLTVNASEMGSIEPRVKLAICLRLLFGEALKSLAQLFCISLASAPDASCLYLDLMCNCPTLAFGHVPTLAELQLRAAQFSKRSAYPQVFQHCVEAIDGILVRTVHLNVDLRFTLQRRHIVFRYEFSAPGKNWIKEIFSPAISSTTA